MQRPEANNLKPPEGNLDVVGALHTYLADATPGSTKYLAFRDFNNLIATHVTLSFHLLVLPSEKVRVGGLRRRIPENKMSQLRIEEANLAAMNVAIERDCVRDPVYEQEHKIFVMFFENIVAGLTGREFSYRPFNPIAPPYFEAAGDAHFVFAQEDSLLYQKAHPPSQPDTSSSN